MIYNIYNEPKSIYFTKRLQSEIRKKDNYSLDPMYVYYGFCGTTQSIH